MSDAIKKLHDYLAKSPSVVYPEDVFAYLPAIEDENAKLRELCKKLYRLADESYVPFKDVNPWMNELDDAIRAMRELGVEVPK
jgi:hypothetical protein